VKYGHDKLDMSEMTVACEQRLIACLTVFSLARDTHALVERSILTNLSLPVVLLSVEVEQSPVGDLDLCLVDYVLIRPAQYQCMVYARRSAILQNAKLYLLDNLREKLDDLFLSQT
jgi:hypothetical protein